MEAILAITNLEKVGLLKLQSGTRQYTVLRKVLKHSYILNRIVILIMVLYFFKGITINDGRYIRNESERYQLCAQRVRSVKYKNSGTTYQARRMETITRRRRTFTRLLTTFHV